MKPLMIMPVFNQVLEFRTVLDNLRSVDLPCDMLIVNNGSNDGTETLIRDSGFPYLDLPQNLGIGYGMICGNKWAMERGYKIAGNMAGNGKMLAEEMQSLVAPVVSGEYDYVTGSRFLQGGDSPNLPLFRRSAIPMVNYFVKAITGTWLSDATCGYRAYRLSLLERADFDWQASWLNTYGYEYYFYAKVVLSGSIRFAEVPVTMKYPPKGARYSKIKPFVGWAAMLKPWLIARAERSGFRPQAEVELSS